MGIYTIYVFIHAAQLGYREAGKLQREIHAIITVHLLLQSACHTLMPPNSTSPQHGYAHSSSRFQGPCKHKNEKEENVLMSLILIVTAIFQQNPIYQVKLSLMTEHMNHQLKKANHSHYPQSRAIFCISSCSSHVFNCSTECVCDCSIVNGFFT